MEGLLKDRGNGVLERVSEGGGGGGVKAFNIEPIPDSGDYIIHGATVNDLKTIFYISGSIGESDFFVPMLYEKMDDIFMINTLDPEGPITLSFNTMEPYLDGVKVSNEVSPT